MEDRNSVLDRINILRLADRRSARIVYGKQSLNDDRQLAVVSSPTIKGKTIVNVKGFAFSANIRIPGAADSKSPGGL